MINVLVVEDNPHNMRLMEQLLEDIDENLEVIKATSGQQALEVAQAIKFDIALMDISLPDMDGMEIMSCLKRYPLLQDTVFIAVTAYAMFHDEEKFRQIFHDYISKPIDDHLFTATLNKWIGDRCHV